MEKYFSLALTIILFTIMVNASIVLFARPTICMDKHAIGEYCELDTAFPSTELFLDKNKSQELFTDTNSEVIGGTTPTTPPGQFGSFTQQSGGYETITGYIIDFPFAFQNTASYYTDKLGFPILSGIVTLFIVFFTLVQIIATIYFGLYLLALIRGVRA